METVMFILKLIAHFTFGMGMGQLWSSGGTFEKFMVIMAGIYLVATIFVSM